MKTSMPVDGFAGGLAASLGPAIKSFAQSKGSSIMAGAQGALMGAQTAVAAEKARDLAMTNNGRADPFAMLQDPQIAEYISNNPSYANALRTGLALFGATGQADVAGMLSKIQGSDLTGQAVERGNTGDISAQNRLISAANGKTYEPFKAVGDTGYAMDSATGNINVGNNALATLFGDKTRSGMGNAEGAPFEAVQNGKPVLVQRYKDGSLSTVTGYQPKPKEGFAITTNPDGTVSVTQGGGASPKLTEGQSKDLVYLTRGEEALRSLDGLDDVLANPIERASGAIPLAGNALVTPNYQKAEQAAKEFLAAVLRKDTGAAITSQEMDIYGKMYLPQPFDSKEVLAQKAQARRIALDAIRSGLGTATPIAPPRGGRGADSVQTPATQDAPPQQPDRQPVRRAMYNGRYIIQYSDGSMEYEQ